MTDTELEVLVAPLPASEDAAHGASYCWDEPFDVLLHWRPRGGDGGEIGHFVALERSLCDFAAFASDLRAHSLPGDCQAAFRWEQLASESGEGGRSLVTPRARRQRLRYALEAFVAEQLASCSTPLSAQSLAVQRFVVPNVFGLPHDDLDWEHKRQQYREAIDEAFAAAAALTDSQLPPLGTSAASAASSAWDPPSSLASARTPLLLLQDEWISAGCSFEHEVVVHVGDGDGDASESAAPVVWKFVSQREHLKFAVHFSPADDTSPSTGRDQDVDSDPYSAAGFHGAYEMEAEQASVSALDASWQVVRYKSTMDFPEDLTDDSRAFACGHWTATRPGTLRFTWENADMNCVLSKQLQFQIAVVPQSELGVDGSVFATRAERLDAIENLYAPGDGESATVRLSDLLALAVKSVNDELPGWCGADEGQSISGDGERDSLSALDDGDAFNTANANQPQRCELVEDNFQTQRINQLEGKVVSGRATFAHLAYSCSPRLALSVTNAVDRPTWSAR